MNFIKSQFALIHVEKKYPKDGSLKNHIFIALPFKAKFVCHFGTRSFNFSLENCLLVVKQVNYFRSDD